VLRTAPCRGRTAGLTEASWGAALNNRVKVLRTERGWSQVELAEKIGISRQSVYAIESGKFDPSLPVAFRIAELFGMRIEEIFEKRTSS
jgi:putative transcriptional regulator